jgi:hypothetical protein
MDVIHTINKVLTGGGGGGDLINLHSSVVVKW